MNAFWHLKGLIEYYIGKLDWGKIEKEWLVQKNKGTPVKQVGTYQLKMKDKAG